MTVSFHPLGSGVMSAKMKAWKPLANVALGMLLCAAKARKGSAKA